MIENEIILLNAYYIGVTCALLVRDILWLRCIMIAAGTCLISYGVNTGNTTVIYWNLLFLSINILQVIRLIYERRPVKIPLEIKDIYEGPFSVMTPREFLYFWKHGSSQKADNQIICTQGEVQSQLIIITAGSVEIKKRDLAIARLIRGSFIAEMGFIMSKPATADVFAESGIEYRTWEREYLNTIKEKKPELWNKIQFIISKDLAWKLEQRN